MKINIDVALAVILEHRQFLFFLHLRGKRIKIVTRRVCALSLSGLHPQSGLVRRKHQYRLQNLQRFFLSSGKARED